MKRMFNLKLICSFLGGIIVGFLIASGQGGFGNYSGNNINLYYKDQETTE